VEYTDIQFLFKGVPMPVYFKIDCNIQDFANGETVFRKTKSTFRADEIGKNSSSDSERQRVFIDILHRISTIIGSREVPVFMEINGQKIRLDKGSIGHAQTGGIIRPLQNGPNGYVETITLANS